MHAAGGKLRFLTTGCIVEETKAQNLGLVQG